MNDLVKKWFAKKGASNIVVHGSANELSKKYRDLNTALLNNTLYPYTDFGDSEAGANNKEWFKQKVASATYTYNVTLMFIAGSAISPNSAAKPCYVCPVQDVYTVAASVGFDKVCPMDLLDPQYGLLFWGQAKALYRIWQDKNSALGRNCENDFANCDQYTQEAAQAKASYDGFTAGFAAQAKSTCDPAQVQKDIKLASCINSTTKTFTPNE
jgi:hypothetical protein